MRVTAIGLAFLVAVLVLLLGLWAAEIAGMKDRFYDRLTKEDLT
jgi:hypothetical protein